MSRSPQVIVVGGGASGLLCAISAAERGLRTLVLEQGPKVGLKILVSGGGRCNFTNLFADPREHFLSQNPHFCLSALRRYPPANFIAMVEEDGIAYHEKKLGQLFCDDSARDIVAMLLRRCAAAGVEIRLRETVQSVIPGADGGYTLKTATGEFAALRVVLACGGLSLPKIASDLAFRTARTLGLEVVAPRAALVPLTWNVADKTRYACLSGVAVDAEVACRGASFRENILFTHRGLSGPAILQISSFWREGDTVEINLLPDESAEEWLLGIRDANPQQRIATALKTRLPNRLVDVWLDGPLAEVKAGSLSPPQLRELATSLSCWEFRAGGSEGYRTAEVTLGGIATDEVSSKTFEIKRYPGLYAIGEALDVTGWLGGYNFQWAWASGWCCGQLIPRT